MPRPKRAGGPEPKKRSRNGCWPCKGRKVKCDELHPACMNCQRQGEICDYSIRLNWDGRGKRKECESGRGEGQLTFSSGAVPYTPLLPTSQTNAIANTSPQNSGIIQALNTDHLNDGFQQSSHHLDYTLRSEHASTLVVVPVALNGVEPYPHPSSQQQLYPQSYERYQSMPVDGGGGKQQRPAVQRVRYSPSQYGGSPSLSIVDNGILALPGFANTSVFHQNSPTSDPPIFTGNIDSEESGSEFTSASRPVKRARHDSVLESRSPRSYNMPPPNGPPGVSYAGSGPFVPWLSTGSPSTPNASSIHSDDASKGTAKLSPLAPYDAAENARRKPSIESLLSGPAGMGSDHSSTPARGSVSTTRGSFSDNRGSVSTYSDTRPSSNETWTAEGIATVFDGFEQLTQYGIDRGFKDLDLGRNDDLSAITGGSPAFPRAHLEHILPDTDSNLEFGFGVQAKDSAFGDDYYAKPVPIMLPKSFEPLPPSLTNNPMHILYFHHFISHTARILVPHHCSSNPFQKLLPKMALRDRNIMSLLLAYSASHRARLLRQPVPNKRIAFWVQDIVPNLLSALNDPNRMVDNSTFATSVMLASLEIICPKAFGAEIGWQQHLNIARQMIAMRGGSRLMHQEHSEVTHFLLKWFAYLDIMGNLTGRGILPESGTSWAAEYDVDDSEHDSLQIDCLLGFTGRCISILAQISDLARHCDPLRIQQFGSEYLIREDYLPSPSIEEKANRLIHDAQHSLAHTAVRKCPHPQASGEAAIQWDNVEMSAVNAAYHWAGLIHLYRRVLGKTSEDTEVQIAVQEILGSLYKVREGSTAEACLLFPMFTAGCDAQDSKQKSDIMKRIKIVEDCGMSQVHKARGLMEKVWETGKPWETLVGGEFVG